MTRKLIFLFLAFPTTIIAITTIHYDRPENRPKIVDELTNTNTSTNSTLVPDRQKRLLPYINYYIDNNNQHYNRPENAKTASYIRFPNGNNDQTKFTPFLESNAIPGPFIPMVKQQTMEGFEPIKNSNFGIIYDKLNQLKFAQQQLVRPPTYNVKYRPEPSPKPQYNYITTYTDENRHYSQPKPIIHTYTPTNIDITSPGQKQIVPEPDYRPQKTFIQHNIALEVPKNSYPIYQEIQRKPQRPILVYEDDTRPVQYQEDKLPEPNIYVPEKERPYIQVVPVKKPVIYIQRKPIVNKLKYQPKYQVQLPNGQIYNTQLEKYIPVEQFEPQKFQQQTPVPVTTPTESSNTLAGLLKQLQDSNMLPHTLTSDNIDNSIRTLVKILTNLKKEKYTSKPIVVAEEDEEEPVEPEPQQHIEDPPDTMVQNFPAITMDGGTPGKPGIDYPALSSIPQTSFDCKTQRYKGFFGDPDTNCQVWHYCDLNGGQASFLCPNGTIFSQVALTCDWWYNVKCSSTPQLYVLNERLYKYIIPLSPKFPEDYSGPLVDKYLALKFKEMEEKVEREKKIKEDEDKTESVEESVETSTEKDE